MKRIVLTAMLFTSLAAAAQSDAEMVEQYARVEAASRVLSNKVIIDVDFGEGRGLWSNNRVRDEETGKIKKFNSITDALNYMGSQGWILVNAFQINSTANGGSPLYHYYFKKLFKRPS
jgi:hypothetical protein